MQSLNSTIADAALAYAAAGLPVLPLEVGRKAPHGMLETREGPGGVYHASTDAERVAYWWREDRDANVGVACGRGIGVLDLDDWTALDRLTSAQRRDLVPAAKVASARGGHFYFRTDEPIKGGRIAPGLSLQGAGTYVCAPPSRHPTGTVYRWLRDGTPWRCLAPLPAWAIRRHLEPLPAARRVPSCETDYIGWRAIAEARARLARRSREPGTGRGTALYAAARFLSEYVGAFLSLADARDALADMGDRLGLDATERNHNIDRGLGLWTRRGREAA